MGEDVLRDSWEQVANLLHIEEALRDFELATGSRIPCPNVTAANPPAVSPPTPVQPLGETIVASAEAAATVASLVGRYVLYWFPKLSKWTLEFFHVMAYSRAKAAFAGTADSLLYMSFYCTRWVLLSPDTSPVP